jgi:proteic killer suppression protein
VIRSFRSQETEQLDNREPVKRFKGIERVALRKLRQLDAAGRLSDLASLPGNRLEALRGDRKGQHSIRINDQWRICFVWRDGDAWEVHNWRLSLGGQKGQEISSRRSSQRGFHEALWPQHE